MSDTTPRPKPRITNDPISETQRLSPPVAKLPGEPDMLDHLAQHARRLRVGRILPPEGELAEKVIEQIQGDFRAFLEKSGLSLGEVAHKMGRGFSVPTLSTFKLRAGTASF